jgi:hypothetical protein
LEKPSAATRRMSRPPTNTAAVDFGAAKTTGAFRCEVRNDQLVITPLPDGESFPLTLRLDKILGRPVTVNSVQALGLGGAAGADVDYQIAGQQLSFTARKQDFAYEIRVTSPPGSSPEARSRRD